VAEWGDVDVVLSGINLGSNLGNSIWHSGTLAAAKQAPLLGLRGIALSSTTADDQPDFDALAPWVERVLELLIERDHCPLLNVNFPLEPRGLRWTRQSVRHYDGRVVPGHDPRGRPHFWITTVPLEAPDEGTDRWAVSQGWISLTPLRLDLTDEKALEEVTAAPA
jgi:5'-nucleotidase